MTDMSHVTHV